MVPMSRCDLRSNVVTPHSGVGVVVTLFAVDRNYRYHRVTAESTKRVFARCARNAVGDTRSEVTLLTRSLCAA